MAQTKKGDVRMFEKEAEEYAQDMAKYYESAHGSIPSQFEKYLRKAVEYGYNKANEWHKVADEGLPKNNNDGATYLLYTIYGPGGSPVVAHFKERDSQLLMNTWTGAILTEDKIISWKECKLPTE
jgi:hypothetical protein